MQHNESSVNMPEKSYGSKPVWKNKHHQARRLYQQLRQTSRPYTPIYRLLLLMSMQVRGKCTIKLKFKTSFEHET